MEEFWNGTVHESYNLIECICKDHLNLDMSIPFLGCESRLQMINTTTTYRFYPPTSRSIPYGPGWGLEVYSRLSKKWGAGKVGEVVQGKVDPYDRGFKWGVVMGPL